METEPASIPAADAPIGVFDSGVGGLSVLREIRELLPSENLFYVADSGHVPYGNKSAQFIVERSRILSQFLLAQGCKALVIACNTATAAAASILRAEWPNIPVIGMEPAVKPAVAATRTHVVGVLATVGTLQSARFAALLDQFSQEARFVTQGCPGLVEFVEAGEITGPVLQEAINGFVRPLLEKEADTIVLGCTHYPFLRQGIQSAAGPAVTLIDTGAAVARQVRRRLQAAGLLNSDSGGGRESFWTTGGVTEAPRVFSTLWGKAVDVAAVS